MVNAQKLNDNLVQITNDETKWKQTVWAEAITDSDVPPVPGECGTAFCLAGWAVVNDGYKLRWNKERIADGPDGKPRYKWYTDHVEDGRLISSVAQEILDISDTDLFDSSNSLARLWTLAEREGEGKIIRPSNAPSGPGTWDDDDGNCDCSACSDEYDDDDDYGSW